MKIKNQLFGAAIASLATVTVAAPTYAIDVMGNLPLSNGNQASTLNGSPSDTPLVTFSTPSPAPTSGARNTFSFTADSSFTLSSEEDYWVVLSGDAFSWMAADPDEAPTSSNGFTTNGYQIKGFGDPNWASSGISNGIAIDASNRTASVPFDFSPTSGFFLVGGLWGANQLRRRKASAKLIED